MKELDFDELDRAVNSLMTGVSKTPQPADGENVKTVTLPSSTPTPTLPPASTPVSPLPSSPSPLTPAERPPSSLATRRSGRFMDVVRPVAPAKKPTPPSVSVSRQGTTVTPSESTPAPTVGAEKESSEVPLSAPSTSVVEQKPPVVAPSESTIIPSGTGDWPDPIDLHGFKDDEPEKPAKAEEVVEQNPVTAKPQDVPSDEQAPLSSPFLPDTKVEKRPLGGTPVAISDETPKPEKQPGPHTATSEDNPQLPTAPPEKVEVPLPEELQNDLVAIESGNATPAKKEAASEESGAKEAPQAPVLKEEPRDEPTIPTGPVSIPQQYREEPTTGDQENGAIYDTDSYHQPLSHPAKKKSGWLWVVWIVLILVLGAGTGAVLYLLGVI
jgi:hypothetical protein